MPSYQLILSQKRGVVAQQKEEKKSGGNVLGSALIRGEAQLLWDQSCVLSSSRNVASFPCSFFILLPFIFSLCPAPPRLPLHSAHLFLRYPPSLPLFLSAPLIRFGSTPRSEKNIGGIASF